MHRTNMHSGFLCFFAVLALSISLPVWAQDAPQSGGDFSNNLHPTEKQKVPEGVIIVKGAWSSVSDNVTPVPEGSSVANSLFSDPYFGLTYALPANWNQRHSGPPPSDSGRYSLALITPTAAYTGSHGSILVTAQDMFFTPLPAANALELVNYTKNNLPADYKLERALTETTIAGHAFTFFAYWSPVAQLHWYVLATQIRCHTVEIVMTSSDTKLLESLILDMNRMTLPAEAGPTAGRGGGAFPVCIKNYAREENVIERTEPVFTQRRFNPVPVRIIIDKQGKIKHIHILSAFPEQEKAINVALRQWRFRPRLRNGQPVEVETGIMFGSAPRPASPPGTPTATD
jgi:hypothetical protein